VSTADSERVGALLRANGRYSLVHRFITGKDGDAIAEAAREVGLGTVCGLFYEPAELYPEGPIFLHGRSQGAITDCAECFPRFGRGRVVSSVPKRENARQK
jgi:hypothetical protein